MLQYFCDLINMKVEKIGRTKNEKLSISSPVRRPRRSNQLCKGSCVNRERSH